MTSHSTAPVATGGREQYSVGRASMWMVGLSILLFWIPTFGPLLAGFVGGREAGGAGSALLAGILPSALVSGLLLLLGTAVALPVVGGLVAGGVFLVLLFQTIPLLIGAAVGGAMGK
jgi:hypothetical protein